MDASKKFMDNYNDPKVKGCTVMNIWRPLMDDPCQHKCLALLDPHSVKPDDIIPTSLLGYTLTGKPTSLGTLRFNPEHQWYYYPDMTKDEVIVFKQFESFKHPDYWGDDAPVKTSYFCSVDMPHLKKKTEKRKSAEYRCRVWFK